MPEERFYLIVDKNIVCLADTEADLVNWANAEGIEEYEIADLDDPRIQAGALPDVPNVSELS